MNAIALSSFGQSFATIDVSYRNEIFLRSENVNFMRTQPLNLGMSFQKKHWSFGWNLGYTQFQGTVDYDSPYGGTSTYGGYYYQRANVSIAYLGVRASTHYLFGKSSSSNFTLGAYLQMDGLIQNKESGYYRRWVSSDHQQPLNKIDDSAFEATRPERAVFYGSVKAGWRFGIRRIVIHPQIGLAIFREPRIIGLSNINEDQTIRYFGIGRGNMLYLGSEFALSIGYQIN